MTPGDIVMMLNEMGGMRVQATSPSLGAASVRVQGMRGRYTRFFSDGLPLFGEVGGLGLLQIPPMDLGQVEVIKGVASSLYGAGAMGGVVNLVSRQPGAEAAARVSAQPIHARRDGRGGLVLRAAVERLGRDVSRRRPLAERDDVNDDAWADLPRYARGIVRPRLFWNDGKGNRSSPPPASRSKTARADPLPYVEALDTRGIDAGLSRSTHRLGSVRRDARARRGRRSITTISSAKSSRRIGTRRRSARSRFAAPPGRTPGSPAPRLNPIATTRPTCRDSITPSRRPACSSQDDVAIAPWLSLSGSARLDHHSEYGTFVSPRVSALLRSGAWNSRVSFGTGFYGPSALTEETEAAGLTRLSMPSPLGAENGRSASFDITRSAGPLSTTMTLFMSRVHRSAQSRS